MKRIFLLIITAILVMLPANAVFNEKDLESTIQVLRFELKSTYTERKAHGLQINKSQILQHDDLIGILSNCDMLSMMLYSQKQDNTFDLTYACHEVNRMNTELLKYQTPFNEIIERLHIEIERFQRLEESLKAMPLAKGRDRGKVIKYFNEKIRPVRDECLFYVRELIKIDVHERDSLLESDKDYVTATHRLGELSNYARKRYETAQHKIFVVGQDSYWYVLSNMSAYSRVAFADANEKYKSGAIDGDYSEWRGRNMTNFAWQFILCIIVAGLITFGILKLMRRKIKWMQTRDYLHRRPAIILLAESLSFALCTYLGKEFIQHNFFNVASTMLMEIAYTICVIQATILIRLKSTRVRAGMKAYMPVITLAILFIVFRIIFIPNRMINLLLPPILIPFVLWQLVVIIKRHDVVSTMGLVTMWTTLIVLISSTVAAWSGYIMLCVLINIWWIFQLTTLLTINSLFHLLKRFHSRRDGMTRTLIYEFIRIVVVPVLTIVSLPYCVYLAADIFDLTDVCREFSMRNFIDVKDIMQISPYKVILVSSLFFVFWYLDYSIKKFYHYFKIELPASQHKRKSEKASQNLILADNVINIITWGVYAVTTMVMLNIPKEGISIVTAGLATGVGFAMRDILNNFFYGIQLMAGRVHLGDFIECDGVRGKVESITYQSTQVTTLDGSVMAILNGQLFSKNFKNLTRNHAYEFVAIPVGVAYGSNVAQVRKIILDAIKVLQTTDDKGRLVVSPDRDVTVDFGGFGDNSVDLLVKQLVLVERKAAYMCQARELIYNAFNENDIEIPFPQRDVHLIPVESKS